MEKISINTRRISTLAFSLLFAYLLAFVFEGQVLYSLTAYYGVASTRFIFAAIIAHFVGLFSAGFFVRTIRTAKRVMLVGTGISCLCTIPFFFPADYLWTPVLIVCAFVCGWGVAVWGFFLKRFTPKNERIKTCADVLIYSNILMVLLNATAVYLSPFMGLLLSLLVLFLSGCCISLLPVTEEQKTETGKREGTFSLRAPMLLLGLFVVILTINSGLMYQVFNPAFEHLTLLTSWYWAVPYIVALIILRNLPVKVKRAYFLYMGIAMIMVSFIAFMLLDRSAVSYLVVDTLMLGACGIFDLFWWSIIGEMLEYSKHPAKIFGMGLSANVLGVLLGGLIGFTLYSLELPSANITVIALAVVCITLIILPTLNRRLVVLLKNHTYLTEYSSMQEKQQKQIMYTAQALTPLTEREHEVLGLLLKGKKNKQIGIELNISENTVKTHVKNLLSKYGVASRTELISTIMQNRAPFL